MVIAPGAGRSKQRLVRNVAALLSLGWILMSTSPSVALADGRRVEQGPSPYRLATVTFIGAVVSLTRQADGLGWESGALDAADVQRYKAAAAKLAAEGAARLDPVAAAQGVLELIGAATVSVMERPDPQGTVELVVDGKRGQQLRLLKAANTYDPSWQHGYVGDRSYMLTWSDVPLDRDARIRLHLEDVDPALGNDNIGTVEVNSDALLRAARARRVVPIYVGDQSARQILFVYVSVTLKGGR